MIRKIIQIDEEKCNGCGACVSACHEGAIGMVNGKAKLRLSADVSDQRDPLCGTRSGGVRCVGSSRASEKAGADVHGLPGKPNEGV